jgi:hypothetical protein
MTLQEINDSYKAKGKAKTRTTPALSTRQDRDEMRIQHVITAGQRKPIDFAKLSEKVNATLEVAQAISAKTSGIRRHFKLNGSLKQFDELRDNLNSLVASLTILQRKLS